MTKAPPNAAEIGAARTFLKNKKMLDIFSPRLFAAAAKENETGLEETLKFLAHLQMGGQGEGEFPETMEAIRAGAR